MNKKDLSERDICSKFIGLAVKRTGWDGMMQIREEVAVMVSHLISETQMSPSTYSPGCSLILGSTL